MSFGVISFLAPLSLIGLLILPLVWWILKITPPKPKIQTFPPLRLLQHILPKEETSSDMPLWLLILRLSLVALIAIALAQPTFTQPDNVRTSNASEQSLVLIMDNGWAAAANWPRLRKEAQNYLSQAQRQNKTVLFITTADPHTHGDFSPASDVIRRLKHLEPFPITPDHQMTAQILAEKNLGNTHVIWLSSGYDFGEGHLLAAQIKQAAHAQRIRPQAQNLPVMAGLIEETANGVHTIWHRAHGSGTYKTDILIYDSNERVIGRRPVQFSNGARRAEVNFELPTELRRHIQKVKAAGVHSAAAVKLLDDNWGRALIGLLDTGDKSSSPLLDESFYTRTALAPYADIFSGRLQDLLPLSPSILIMPDTARIESQALQTFVESGGLLIRFAGPKLAARNDPLLPVVLRQGDRALGGALTWEAPQKLAPPEPDSPFFGLNIPDDVRINRQIMAEPGPQTDSRTWARLEDGAPIVTAAPFGLGQVVLFHVTAGPNWSNLAVSGLYVDMLRRLLPLARHPNRIRAVSQNQNGEWVGEYILDGFGRKHQANPAVRPISASAFDSYTPDIQSPPGVYRQGIRRAVLPTLKNPQKITLPSPIVGLEEGFYGQNSPHSLTGWLLILAFCILLLDILITLSLSGRINLQRFTRASLMSITALAMTVIYSRQTTDAIAQVEADIAPALELHLAYIKTDQTAIDQMSEDALKSLVNALIERTTIEPAGVRGVNPEQDTLVFFPFLYFPIKRNIPALSAKASAALNAYMASGGTIVFDTQDAGDRTLFSGQAHPGLTRITQSLDMPNIMRIPSNHVLTKSFYLLQTFPGRWASGNVWVDQNRHADRHDGVSSIIIGSNDWSAGWATHANGDSRVSLSNEIPRQQEMAIRFGINLTMYSLSGNYKGDQVHTAELVKRLGLPESQPEQQP